MTHRDRAGDPSGQRAGRREAAGPAGIVKSFRRPHRFARCRFACATGTPVSQGFRTAHGSETGRMACDARHRRTTRSWPKALGNRLYGSLSTLLGIIPNLVDTDPFHGAGLALPGPRRKRGARSGVLRPPPASQMAGKPRPKSLWAAGEQIRPAEGRHPLSTGVAHGLLAVPAP